MACAAPPLVAFGQLPNLSDIEVSPDGARYAASVGNEMFREVQIRMLGSNELVEAFPLGAVKVRAMQWAGPNHLVVTKSTAAQVIGVTGPRREWFQLADYDVRKRHWNLLLKAEENSMNVVFGAPTSLVIDGKPTLVAMGIYFPASQGVMALYRIDLDTQHTTRIEIGNEQTYDYLIGNAGNAVARSDYAEGRGVWTMLLKKPGGSWTRNRSEDAAIDQPDLRALAADGESILVNSHRSGDWRTYAVGLADGKWSEPLPDIDEDGLLLDPATRQMIGSVKQRLEGVRYRFVDATDQKHWDAIARAFPGEQVSLASWSQDRSRLVVEVEGAEHGDGFFSIDLNTHKADWMGDRYAGIAANDTAERRLIHYKAADGLDIPAFLTLPRGIPARGLPLVVLSHGGPASSDKPGFDWWSQALASRGYAVLQPQFRGSTGLGVAHLEAGYGQWGRKMQTDLSDGVRHLSSEGTIDAKRVCIVGGSYGGYAALAGVTLDPGVYRCAASLAGVSDLRRMLVWEGQQSDGEAKRTMRYFQRFLGAKSSDDRSIDAYSPITYAAKLKVPVLLIHGKDDTVVSYEQSTVMEKALRAAGGDVELVTLKAEDHWLSHSATRIQMLDAMVTFLEKHNPPGVVAGRGPGSMTTAAP